MVQAAALPRIEGNGTCYFMESLRNVEIHDHNRGRAANGDFTDLAAPSHPFSFLYSRLYPHSDTIELH